MISIGRANYNRIGRLYAMTDLADAHAENMMSEREFEFGDRVRHAGRPEWGTGSVVKAERTNVDGRRAQRVSVRFPNVGLKILSTDHAVLHLVNDHASADAVAAETHPLAVWQKMSETDWLAPLARRKVEQVMVTLGPQARDPFDPLRKRLAFTLDLYRFERTGQGLVDWAIAQSTLDDPLSRFSRQELEQFFDRWAAQRDSHLDRLLQEGQNDPAMVNELVALSSPAVRETVRRLTAGR